jgi:hypothetical protein
MIVSEYDGSKEVGDKTRTLQLDFEIIDSLYQ